MAASIEIKNLAKNYGALQAVDHISLRIAKGEIFALLGPNGAGKTTLLMMLSTLLKPSSGEAIVNGFSVTHQASRVRQSIGMVFQDPSSDELLSGYENLKLHALMYNLPWKKIDERIDEVMSLVDLLPRKHSKVKTYSGGMRRRMEIARGLLHKPEVLFLDEPTLGLDPQTREHIWRYIESLAKETGMTIVLTTHYMEEAEKLCSRVAIIDHGRIIANDSPENLRQSVAGDRVSLKGRDIPLEQLKKLAFVRKAELISDRLELVIDDAGKNLPALLNAAGQIEFVEVRAPDLNDVFLHYTGTAIREDKGSITDHMRSMLKAKNK